MVEEKIIGTFVNKLVQEYNPVEIYLFGSYAWGKPEEDSDIDILVVVGESDEKPYKRIVRALKALRDISVAKDILVYTKEEFDNMSDDVTTLCYKVKNEGVKLYEAARSLVN